MLEAEGLDSRATAALATYGDLVLETNRRLNITGARTVGEIAAQISDSLTVVPYIREPYVDVGSGAGFPAVPIAIATGIHITMIEATSKKARVLSSFLKSLGLSGRVIAERAEVAGHQSDLRERFASGTCRAVASGPAVVELLLPLIAIGGVAVLQRGPRDADERAALEDASLVLGGTVESESTATGTRRVVLVRKERPTPARFPRRTGVPQKRPLCE